MYGVGLGLGLGSGLRYGCDGVNCHLFFSMRFDHFLDQHHSLDMGVDEEEYLPALNPVIATVFEREALYYTDIS